MEIRIEVSRRVSSLQAYLEAVRSRFVAVHAAAARYLELGEADLRERLSAGDSLGDLADFQGRSLEGLRQVILDTLRDPPAHASAGGTSHTIPDGRRTDDHPTFSRSWWRT